MRTVRESHIKNYEYSQVTEFTDWMIATIASRFVRVMRVHVSGDFYDSEYVRKWIDVVRRSPHCQFFAYTRSWQIEEMLPELVALGSLRNFQLWWSIDRATGSAPTIRGIRRAYMAISDVDAENAPDDCDLVFRDQPDTVMKKANGIQVCPPENGVVTQVNIGCSNCGICWKHKDTRWERDLLPYIDGTEINAPDR